MSIEEQIEEIDVMANDIAMTCPDLVEDGCGRRSCVECLANGMSDLGYRKASDVAWEIIADLENDIDGLLKVFIEERAKECTIDTPLAEWLSGKIDAYSSVKFRLAELKKKYTEGEG